MGETTIKCFIATIMVAASLSVCQVLAQNEVGEAAFATDAALAPVDPFAAEQAVNAQLQNFLATEIGKKLQANPDNKVMSAYDVVSKSTNAASWGMSRPLAYNRAWAAIQQEFLVWQYRKSEGEAFRRLFEDASSGTPSYQLPEYTGSDAIDEFIDKSGAFLSSKLDSALREAGVDPEAYSRGKKKQRKDLVVDAIRNSSTIKAFGKLSGLLPIKSFSGVVDGQEAIGVIGLYNPKYAELAGEIAGRQQIMSNGASGRPLGERLTKDPAQLLSSFGVRVLRDEQGYPLLVSYGQSALSKTNASPSMMSSLRKTALGRARSAANRAMDRFIKSNSNYTDTDLLGESKRDLIEVDRQNFTVEYEETELKTIHEELSTTKFKSELSGVSSFTEWTYKHPETGHILVGVVLVWSPVEEARARAIATGNRATKTAEVESRNSQGPSWMAESQDLVDPGDF